MAIFGSLAIVPWILFAQSSWMIDTVPVITADPPRVTRPIFEIRDRGEVFGREAKRRALTAFRALYHHHHIPAVVETVPSLRGARIADVARRRARVAGEDRLYILVARDERDVEVIGSQQGPASLLTDAQREAIRLSFLGPLGAGDPDKALDRGVQAIPSGLRATATGAGPSVRLRVASTALPLMVLAWLLGREALAWLRRKKSAAEAVAVVAWGVPPAGAIVAPPRGRTLRHRQEDGWTSPRESSPVRPASPRAGRPVPIAGSGGARPAGGSMARPASARAARLPGRGEPSGRSESGRGAEAGTSRAVPTEGSPAVEDRCGAALAPGRERTEA